WLPYPLAPELRIYERKFHLFHYTKQTFSNQAENLTLNASFFPHLFCFFFSLLWNLCSSPPPALCSMNERDNRVKAGSRQGHQDTNAIDSPSGQPPKVIIYFVKQ
ncbi:hypothetical protein P9747_20465, partial [Paenibacillus macerans]|uniref:hypothetical protein n=1 Tax=Paenibacillus macerans TaxID=44252 RepID=UPI002E1AB306|nr:hypothetical protein [Paenibacillus macerans]